MQDSKEKQCLIFVRNNANDTADRIEAYSKGNITLEILFMESKGRLLIPGERMLKQMHQHGSE